MIHKSVLLQEVIKGTNPKKGENVFDGTLGAGGYSREFLNKIGEKGFLISTDLDKVALDNFKSYLDEKNIKNAQTFNGNFSSIKSHIKDSGLKDVDIIVLDLGYSSDQIENSGRGLSFQNLEDSLAMTLSSNLKEGSLTAKEIVNTWDEENLADIIYGYGGERYSRKIAKAIVKAREEKSIEKVGDLVGIIDNAVGGFYRRLKIHPATKTFQALRITVNDELGHLRKVLEDGFDSLSSGGRFAVVSFHSLEDRIVKNFFRDKQKEGLAENLYKKPLTPSQKELEENKRSRSSKLRILIKK